MKHKPDFNPLPDHCRSKSASICMLASGSRGNAVYISSGSTSLLVDAGLSGAELERRLKLRGISPEELDAIVVSHEHDDHLRGVGVLARKHSLPVYISPETETEAHEKLGRIETIRHFCCGIDFFIGDISVHPFSTSHDACDPAGFTFSMNGCKIGIATDMGAATRMVKYRLRGCSCLVLEANHDPRMLEEGPYPWPLKQRIKSRTGHLSNDDSRSLLMDVMHEGLSHVILAHLSGTNNTPEKALSAVAGYTGNCRPEFTVALQDSPSPVIYL